MTLKVIQDDRNGLYLTRITVIPVYRFLLVVCSNNDSIFRHFPNYHIYSVHDWP